MKTIVLVLTAAATLGLAAPASANDTARGTAQLQSQDFSSSHRHHWRHHRHHGWRGHYGWGYQNCFKVWRYGRLVTVCR